MIIESNKDILDEDFDGDLDAELAEVDEILKQAEPSIYIGELVDEDLKNRMDIYACTELRLVYKTNEFVITRRILDVVGDEMYEEAPTTYATLNEAVSYLKTLKLHNCSIDLDSLLINN